jgi:hypothetical protein
MKRQSIGMVILLFLTGWFLPTGIRAGVEFFPTTVIPDFKVNENAGVGEKKVPAVASDKSGNLMMVWTDYRDGEPAIYAQRYNSSGAAQGGNFRVCEEPGSYSQEAPAVAADGMGNFFVAWQDGPGYGKKIFVQKFNAAGTRQGSAITVNTQAGAVYVHDAAVAADGSGNFIVAWIEDRDAKTTVYVQRFNAAGSALGTFFTADGYLQSDGQSHPSVAMDGSGNFVVAWQDAGSGDNDIRAQLFNKSGEPLGQAIRVNDDLGAKSQSYPAVAANVNGKGMVVWTDDRNGQADIYGRYFDWVAFFNASAFRINDDAGSTQQLYPCAAVDRLGYFAVAWQDERNGSSDIYMQRYGNPWIQQKPNMKVNDNAASAYQTRPAMAMNETGDFAIVWQDRRNNFSELYAQRYSANAVPQAGNFGIADDSGSAEQIHSDIAVAPTGAFMIVWQDRRNGLSNIYAQFYDASGIAQGPNIQVNAAGAPAQNNPVIACYAYGYFLIVWEEVWYGIPDIYAQDFSQTGNPQGASFKVNDDGGGARHTHPAISANGQGNIVIAWEDERNGNLDIYGQRYDSALNPIGGNFRANDNGNVTSQTLPSVGIDQAGNFAIAWEDERSGDMDIYAQRYNYSGVALKSNFWINDDSGQALQMTPALAMDQVGNFTVVWSDARAASWGLYGQHYNSAGVKKGGNFLVHNQYGGLAPAVAINAAGECLVAWYFLNWEDSDVYAMRFDNLGNPVGGIFQIPQHNLHHQINPRIQLVNHKMYSTWETNHNRGVGYDIWANILDWNSPDTHVTSPEDTKQPASCVLLQNFPNPFNSQTLIRYQLLEPRHVRLEIVASSGRAVKVIFNGEQSAGSHQLLWDGCDEHMTPVSSGLYFCRMASRDRNGNMEQQIVKLDHIK